MTIFELLQSASDAFRQGGVKGLLIGGIAVNHHGYSRNTQDVDLMVAAYALDDVERALKSSGFTNIEREPNVIFFRRPESDLRLDVLHVDKDTFEQLWSESLTARSPDISFRIPRLEHLLAMKLFALKANWDRRVHKDLPDIINLVIINQLEPEATLRPMCQRHADEQIYQRILSEINRTKL